jgi:hypothetical protein
MVIDKMTRLIFLMKKPFCVHYDKTLKTEIISDPRELCSEGEIIVVTIQYRLGSFGFLFLDDPKVPGNVGILDQRMGTTVLLTF